MLTGGRASGEHHGIGTTDPTGSGGNACRGCRFVPGRTSRCPRRTAAPGVAAIRSKDSLQTRWRCSIMNGTSCARTSSAARDPWIASARRSRTPDRRIPRSACAARRWWGRTPPSRRHTPAGCAPPRPTAADRSDQAPARCGRPASRTTRVPVLLGRIRLAAAHLERRRELPRTVADPPARSPRRSRLRNSPSAVARSAAATGSPSANTIGSRPCSSRMSSSVNRDPPIDSRSWFSARPCFTRTVNDSGTTSRYSGPR